MSALGIDDVGFRWRQRLVKRVERERRAEQREIVVARDRLRVACFPAAKRKSDVWQPAAGLERAMLGYLGLGTGEQRAEDVVRRRAGRESLAECVRGVPDGL